MSWVEARASCLLLVGARTARLFVAADTPVASCELTEPQGGSLDTAALGALLAQASLAVRTRVQVVISDVWLASAELPWFDGLLDARGALDFARGQLELAGNNASDLEISLDDPPPGQMRIACALPRGMLAELEALAVANRVELDCVVPLSACVIAARREALPAERALLGILESGAVTLATLADGRLRSVVSRGHAGNALAMLEGLWRRQRLRDASNAALDSLHVVGVETGDPAVTESHVVMLAMPSAAELAAAARRTSALDFVRRPRAPRVWQWATAAVLALVTVALLWQVRQVRTDLTTSQTELLALRAEPARPPRPEGAARRAQEDELRVARMQWSALELPLDELFAAVRPPAEVRAALLSVELAAPRQRANSSTVRLSGEARDSEAMTLYLAHLGSTRPFVGAELTHHEAVNARAGGAHRFTMEATWTR